MERLQVSEHKICGRIYPRVLIPEGDQQGKSNRESSLNLIISLNERAPILQMVNSR
jgi:hypothetical protein